MSGASFKGHPIQPVERPARSDWKAASAAVPGAKHLRRGIPCQDAAAAGFSPRPFAIVCDGRGTASESDRGAGAAVVAFGLQLEFTDFLLDGALDQSSQDSARRWAALCGIYYRALAGEQSRLAHESGLEPKEFEFTVSAAVIGRQWMGYFCVGDSPIVLWKGGSLGLLEVPDRGSFANHTRFVRFGVNPDQQMVCGIVPIDRVDGLAILSDGSAPMFVHSQGQHPAPGITNFIRDVASGKRDRQSLYHFLTEQSWENLSHDDRSLAILARSAQLENDCPPDRPTRNLTQRSAVSPEATDPVTNPPPKLDHTGISWQVRLPDNFFTLRNLFVTITVLSLFQVALLVAIIAKVDHAGRGGVPNSETDHLFSAEPLPLPQNATPSPQPLETFDYQ